MSSVKKLVKKPVVVSDVKPRIEIVYDKDDRRQPYKVAFYNSEQRSVFQKMIVYTFTKALVVFRRNLIMKKHAKHVMEDKGDGGKRGEQDQRAAG